MTTVSAFCPPPKKKTETTGNPASLFDYDKMPLGDHSMQKWGDSGAGDHEGYSRNPK